VFTSHPIDAEGEAWSRNAAYTGRFSTSPTDFGAAQDDRASRL
jgi:hypothetical protein